MDRETMEWGHRMILRIDRQLEIMRDAAADAAAAKEFSRRAANDAAAAKEAASRNSGRIEEHGRVLGALTLSVHSLDVSHGRLGERLSRVETALRGTQVFVEQHGTREEGQLEQINERLDDQQRQIQDIEEVVQPALRRAVLRLWRWASRKAREDGALLKWLFWLLSSLVAALYWMLSGGNSLPKG